jgi:uncharacterized protein YciI
MKCYCAVITKHYSGQAAECGVRATKRSQQLNFNKGENMFVVLLKFSENKAQSGEFMDGHNLWIRQGFDDGIFLAVGSLQPNLGGSVIVHNISLSDLQNRVNTDPLIENNVVTSEIIEIDLKKTDERLQFLLD